MKYKGFTLIELMVVVVIMGILMAMGAIQFASLINRGRIKGAADKISREILGGRERAFSRANPIDLIFGTSSKGGLAITMDYLTVPDTTRIVPSFDDCRVGRGPITVKAPESGTGALTLDIDFAGANICHFLPSGVGTVGAVYIHSYDNKYYYAVVVNANGRVSKWMWGGNSWTLNQ